jgi:hypothetical protein
MPTEFRFDDLDLREEGPSGKPGQDVLTPYCGNTDYCTNGCTCNSGNNTCSTWYC